MMSISGALRDVIPTSRANRLAAITAFAIGIAALPAIGAPAAASKTVDAAQPSETTDVSARRKLRRTAHKSRRVRHARVRAVRAVRARHARSHGDQAQHHGGREASIAPELRSLIANLRQRYGADSVRVISGRDGRAYARSCHPLGQAFDAHVSRAVMADLRSRHFGLITYSGGMHHVHVSSCAREAGLRAHKNVGGRNIFARYMGKMRRRG
jgi:hypothetical protein